ncbi:MAG: gspH [Gammaproteobacteria bacterium]|jgi:general secretion pathway protein H|nr:gspH [Gammaproteobacteria bacterium]
MALSTLPATLFPRNVKTVRAADRGFTLIEILIVILIISIISGIAALTLSYNQRKQYEDLANHISQLLKLAEEEAMLRPATLGLAFTPTGFQFFEYHPSSKKNKNLWQAVTDNPYGLQHFPKNLQVTVFIQNKKTPLDGQPHIIISTSGDIIPFIIWIGKKDQPPSYQITGYANGNIISGPFYEK